MVRFSRNPKSKKLVFDVLSKDGKVDKIELYKGMDFEKLGDVVVEGPLGELVEFILNQPEVWDPAVDAMNDRFITLENLCFDELVPNLIDEIAEINRRVGPVLYIHNDNVETTIVFVRPKSFKNHDGKDNQR